MLGTNGCYAADSEYVRHCHVYLNMISSFTEQQEAAGERSDAEYRPCRYRKTAKYGGHTRLFVLTPQVADPAARLGCASLEQLAGKLPHRVHTGASSRS